MKNTILCAVLALAVGRASAEPAEIGNSICCGPSGCGVTALSGFIESQAHALDRLRASDDELNRTYAAVLTAYEGQDGAIASIRKAQRKWIELRDLDLEAERLSWAGQADVETHGVEDSVLFAGIREKRNLDRARYFCEAYLAERG